MPSRDHQGQHGELQLTIALLPLLQQHGMNVAFQMVDRNQRLIERKGQRLGVADPDQQRSGQSRALGDGDCVQRVVSLIAFSQRLPDNGNNRPQMLARRQLRNHSAIGLVGGNLRSHNVRNKLLSRTHHRRSGFIAGTFDAENVCVEHEAIVLEINDRVDETWKWNWRMCGKADEGERKN